MKKKKVALVFGATDNYVFALANTLIGLKKHNKKFWDDILIYHDGITDENQSLIKKIVDCEFILMSKDVYFKNMPDAIEKYSLATFFRFECFDLLNKYEQVIWNDCDILIQGDISGLCDYKSGFAITQTNGKFMVESNFVKIIPEYNMYHPLYNAGMLVLTDNLIKYDEMRSWCISSTAKYLNNLRWPDQGIINLLIQAFNITPELIDINKYCCHPTQSKFIKDASIIHAYGDRKFWSDQEYLNIFKEWKENNFEWNKILWSSKKQEQPLVSCVMSTYNRYEFLKESVNSILNQTYRNFELIIVLEKCENQEKIEKLLRDLNDSRIVIIKNTKKLGFAASLNVGIEHAKGKYIARMDDDDISTSDRFEEEVLFMESHASVGICGSKAQIFGKNSDIINVLTDNDKLKILSLSKTPFVHPTIIMRKELLDKYNLRYNPEYFSEDYQLWGEAAKYLEFANIDKILLNYRSSGTNLTTTNNENKIHASHKKTMYYQFKNYLNLDPTDNELELFQGRKEVLEYCMDKFSAIKIRNEFCDKIIEANKKANFYNQDILEIMLKSGKLDVENQGIIKRGLKHIIRPLYNRVMSKIERRINDHDATLRYDFNIKYEKINEEIEEIRNEKK
jgi:glycosyltransferase involved in cell wall biosynthesis